ncbi:hypothetical protein [Priestia megaterium]|uniref:deoxynucleotide monophosphate kinase family protein n=1 Tax=Priestia megaterium TaxID=1404 RepID=UPI0023DA12E7|nr:hypothetical protein [Priestia megaterium]MDF2010228.1 hypothetical protein [Priestia megaterium]
MKLKLAIAGEIRSGKDTFSDYVLSKLDRPNKLYFAEGIEKIIREFFPEAFEGNNKPREYYQEIGQFMRQLNPLVWINYTSRKYEELKLLGMDNFVLTDLRQMNEYQWLKANGFTVIKVEAEPEIRIERMKQAGDKFNMQSLLHPVEQQISALPYDYLVTNNTTLEDLYKQADFILQELKEEGGV